MHDHAPPPRLRRTRIGLAATLGVAAVVAAPLAFGQGTHADFDGEVPNRIADTREGDPRSRLSDGETMQITLASSDPIAFNLAAVTPTGNGYIEARACSATSADRTSALNFTAGVNAVSNLVVTEPDGGLCIFARVADGGSVDVTVDRLGTMDLDDPFDSVVPAERDFDSRDDLGRPVAAGETILLDGLPASTALMLNVTAVDPADNGYVTAHPCDETRPTVSSGNYTSGANTSMAVVASTDADGMLCIYTRAETDIVVDRFGALIGDTIDAPGSERLFDSRTDGARGHAFSIEAPDANGRAVIISVAAVDPDDDGFVTAYPCGSARPEAASLNFRAGANASNLTIVEPQAGTDLVCFYARATIDLVVDLHGYLGEEATDPGTSNCEQIAANFTTKGSVNPTLADPISEAECDGDEVVVTSNGIPDYTYIQTSPGDPAPQDYTFTFPATPTVAADTTDVPLLGPIAVATNGVPIYGPTEGTGGDVLSLVGGLSDCGSHNGPTGFHIHLFGTSDTTDCMYTPAEAAAGPQLLGYAFDGYPIYTGNDQYTSSWTLTNASLFASDTWAAHSFVEGSGDLDECNGRTDAFGNYAYYTTHTFPYVLGCYVGEVTITGAGGGPGGGPVAARPDPDQDGPRSVTTTRPAADAERRGGASRPRAPARALR